MTLTRYATQLRDGFLDLLFPIHCVGCGKEGAYICAACQETLPRVESPWCARCGLPRSGPCLCGTNRDRYWALDGLRSPFRFEAAVREAIHSLKYRNIRGIAPLLAVYLADFLRDEPLPRDLLVPVPLHRKRLRERGYNQAEIIVNHLSALMELPVATDCLLRDSYAGPQARSADAEERRSNVARAFSCTPGSVTALNVLIVDDVTTTGATLEACAIQLKRAGASSVWGLTVAREL